jgi:hypothetical protein
MSRNRRRRGGFILVVALVIMLVLVVAATGFLTQAEQAGQSAVAGAAQSAAALRAEQAAQDAVRAIRSNQIVLRALTARTPPDGAANCANVNCLTRVHPAGPANLPLLSGGGLQWEWVVYKSGQPGTPANRYVIQATGFYGYTATAANFTSSRVEVEIDVGTPTGFQANEYFGNSGSL